MFYGLNYTQEIERWSKGLHIHRWCTRPDQEAQKDIGAPHHCEMLRLSISANVTPEHAASSQVAAWLWSPLTSVQDTAGEGFCCCAPAANTQSYPEFANMKTAIATKFLPNKAFE